MTTPPAYSVLLPFGPLRPEQVTPFAALAAWGGAARFWQGQGMGLDSHHLATWLAGAGVRVPCGFGVTLMPFRSPYGAALEARSVAMSTGQPVVACYGPGAVSLQEGLLGAPYRSQVGAAREYLTVVRALLDGEYVEHAGEHFRVDGALVPGRAPRIHLGLGVLRPRMAGTAGEVADVAVTWLTPAAYLRDTLVPAAAAATRHRPEPLRWTVIVPFALDRAGRDVAPLVAAACGSHVQQPHYRDTLARAGVDVTADDALTRLVEAGVFLHGEAADIAAALRRYADAGVTEVVLNATGVAAVHGPRAALADLEELLAHLNAAPPSAAAPSVPPTRAPVLAATGGGV